jgi:hypothetical protein
MEEARRKIMIIIAIIKPGAAQYLACVWKPSIVILSATLKLSAKVASHLV